MVKAHSLENSVRPFRSREVGRPTIQQLRMGTTWERSIRDTMECEQQRMIVPSARSWKELDVRNRRSFGPVAGDDPGQKFSLYTHHPRQRPERTIALGTTSRHAGKGQLATHIDEGTI
jgi:hypothetical protein